jgi:hypothetical protein
VRSPARSSSALVATVVPMRMELMRDVSSGTCLRACRGAGGGGCVCCSAATDRVCRRTPADARTRGAPWVWQARDLLQHAPNALARCIGIVGWVLRQQLQHPALVGRHAHTPVSRLISRFAGGRRTLRSVLWCACMPRPLQPPVHNATSHLNVLPPLPSGTCMQDRPRRVRQRADVGCTTKASAHLTRPDSSGTHLREHVCECAPTVYAEVKLPPGCAHGPQLCMHWLNVSVDPRTRSALLVVPPHDSHDCHTSISMLGPCWVWHRQAWCTVWAC